MKNREIIENDPYAVGGHQQFVDKKGNLVRIVRGNPHPMPIGEAYAFFDCNASQQQIEQEIPTIRNLTQIPNELEIYLMKGLDSVKGGPELRQITQEARDAGIKYAIRANHPNATNRQTAGELAQILNQAYQSPLFEEGEEFRGAIFYKQNGNYISLN